MKHKTSLSFCMHKRHGSKPSCAAHGAKALRRYAKARAETIPGLKVRKTDCLGYCKHGPVVETSDGLVLRCQTPEAIDRLLACYEHDVEHTTLADLAIGRKKS